MKGVLYYNLPREKLARIRVILLRLGLSAKEVSPAEYALPLGYLAGLPGFENAEAAEAGSFSGEMLVMCELPAQTFSAFLNALRANRCGVALKAVLTETNASWSSIRLYRELSAEHEALRRAGTMEAAEKSAHCKTS